MKSRIMNKLMILLMLLGLSNAAVAASVGTGGVGTAFSKNSTSVGVVLGSGSAFDDNYVILGLSVGYYVVNGLELGIDLQLRLLVESAAEIQRTLDLAAIQFCGDCLPESLFVRAHLVRKPELHVEVTVVDRAYFPGQCADFRVTRFARKACHTV